MRCSSFARRSAALAAALVVLPACQVSTVVGVDARSDGSGVVRATVTLDREASAQAGDLGSRLRVDDLRAAGWRVNPPTPTRSGGQLIEASKPFATPHEATVVVEQLSGSTGPFQSFRVTRSRSFLKTRTSFSGVVDLSRGLASFSDADLKARFGGSDLGFDPAELETRLGRALSQVFPIRVAARLPGSLTSSNAPTEATNGAQWSPKLGERVTLRASAERWNRGNIAAAGLALAGALALVALGLRSLARRR